ncbi:MAG: glutamine-hydrolyzing GMP synthase [Deltaproteobacteria bacterium]|nr:glutamine-hydrolyzing GMP synthase [Deltaproteobacteria bacterium]
MRTTPVVILDFGSQYTQLIARRVRELGVYCEIHPFHRKAAEIDKLAPQAIILSGGPASVDEPDAPMPDPGLFALGLPILGICYGCQYLTHALGGHVARSPVREFGRARVAGSAEGRLFRRMFEGASEVEVWMSHSDHIEALAPGFEVALRSGDGVIAAIQDPARRLFGVQFHPEVHHTPRGRALLEAFLFDIAGVTADWTPSRFVDDTIQKIRAQVGDGHVICGLSGGVDSAVAAALVHRAIGDRLHCIFVDSGLLRKDEAPEVVRTFRDELGFSLTAVDAGARFFAALGETADPEHKRKTIGRVFIEVFDEAAKAFSDARFLCQGTLYPDVIESVSVRGPSATIKTHHNVGGLPDKMHLALVEPLRELFKDEVRNVGRELGLPERVLMREPFPGPGLAIRVLGPVTPPRVATLQEADAIVREELQKVPQSDASRIWQSFAVLLPVRSVGVMGDNRTYDEVCAVRAVSSVDGMTADVFPVPHDILGRIATRIVNEVRGINRVVYDITSKPPGTIEWE